MSVDWFLDVFLLLGGVFFSSSSVHNSSAQARQPCSGLHERTPLKAALQHTKATVSFCFVPQSNHVR
jgi:hypothetical protein